MYAFCIFRNAQIGSLSPRYHCCNENKVVKREKNIKKDTELKRERS